MENNKRKREEKGKEKKTAKELEQEALDAAMMSIDEDVFVPATPEVASDEGPEPKKQKRFRINGRQFYLTYPKCPLPLEEALKQLKKVVGVGVVKYLIAQEKHLVSFCILLSVTRRVFSQLLEQLFIVMTIIYQHESPIGKIMININRLLDSKRN